MGRVVVTALAANANDVEGTVNARTAYDKKICCWCAMAAFHASAFRSIVHLILPGGPPGSTSGTRTARARVGDAYRLDLIFS